MKRRRGKRGVSPLNVINIKTNNMKRIFLFTLCLVHFLLISAQSATLTEYQISSILKDIVRNQHQYIGQTLFSVYDNIRQNQIPIRWFSTSTSSPWIDPNGIAYLEDVVIYTADIDEMDSGNIYFELCIEVQETNINDHDFLYHLPEYDLIQSFLNRTSPLHVKSIRLFVNRKVNHRLETLESYDRDHLPE